jgi:hypothetical protein
MWVKAQDAFGGRLYNMDLCEMIDVEESSKGNKTGWLIFIFPGLGREMVGRYATIEDAYRAAEDIVTFGDGCKIWNL